MHIILETPRLLLRQFTDSDEDAALMFELNSDAEVLKYLHEPPLQNKNQAKEIIRNIILPQYKNNLGRWAVHLKDRNEFIGWCGLKFLADRNEIDLGYRFKKSAWGKGYATEAATHTLEFGLLKLNIEIIVGRAHVDNIGSVTVLQKIGMHFTGNDIIEGMPHKVFQKSLTP